MVPLTDISSPVVIPCKIVPSNADSFRVGLPDLNIAMVVFFPKYIKKTGKTKGDRRLMIKFCKKTGKIGMNGRILSVRLKFL